MNTEASADSYAVYVKTTHSWADSLGTSADEIEYYLWSHSSDEGFRAACGRVHGR